MNTILEEGSVREVIPQTEGGEGDGHCGVSAEQSGAVGEGEHEAGKGGRARRPRRKGCCGNWKSGGWRRAMRRCPPCAGLWRVFVAAAMRRCVDTPRSLTDLPAKVELRISREEMQRAWEETPAELQNALRSAAKNIRAFAERQLPQEWSFSPVPGLETGQVIRGSRFVWMLCAERTISAAFDAADDGDSGAGGGRKEDCGGVSAARTGDAGSRMDAGR